MKVLIILAKGFEMMEFSPFVDILGWAKTDYEYDVSFETCGFTKVVTSSFGIMVTVDHLIEEINVSDYDALAIPGGFEEYGFYEEAYDERFLQVIKEFDLNQKIIASVCVGSLALGKSGILKNRRATTYHLDGGYRQNMLREFGAEVINEPVVTDERIISSYCPQTAPFVGFSLLEMLTSKEQMEQVKAAMGY